MPTRRLTLYDFLADFVPGIAAVVSGVFLWWLALGGWPPVPGDGLGFGIALLAIGYLIGRIMHLGAGRFPFRKLRKYHFDQRIFNIEKKRQGADQERENEDSDDGQDFSERELNSNEEQDFSIDVDRDFPMSEASFTKRVHRTTDNNIKEIANGTEETDIDRCITARLLFGLDRVYNLTNNMVVKNPEQAERFGYSLLYNRDALYHRYNIMTTFYRNLWFVATIFAMGFFVLTVVGVFSLVNGVVGWFGLPSLNQSFLNSRAPIWLGGGFISTFLLLLFAYFFARRRIQFKDRQVTAFITDLYLLLEETDTDSKQIVSLLSDATDNDEPTPE